MTPFTTYGLYTDYNYHGTPVEASMITIYADESCTDTIKRELERIAQCELHAQCKRMPYAYWRKSTGKEKNVALL